MPDHKSDKQSVVMWAQELLKGAFVVLDTETTGKKPNSNEAVSIAVIDQDGNILLDTLVKPTIPIEPGATRVHGISDDDVADAPDFSAIAPDLCKLITDVPVVIYNADYDVKILHSSARAAGLIDFPTIHAHCAMLQFADFAGAWSDYFGNNSWWKLGEACRYLDVAEFADKAHSAVGDAQRTLALVKALAATDSD